MLKGKEGRGPEYLNIPNIVRRSLAPSLPVSCSPFSPCFLAFPLSFLPFLYFFLSIASNHTLTCRETERERLWLSLSLTNFSFSLPISHFPTPSLSLTHTAQPSTLDYFQIVYSLCDMLVHVYQKLLSSHQGQSKESLSLILKADGRFKVCVGVCVPFMECCLKYRIRSKRMCVCVCCACPDSFVAHHSTTW